MAELIRDQNTGAYSYANPNEVINTVTGQKASTLTPVSAPAPYTPEALTGTEKPIDVPLYSPPQIPDTTDLADILEKYQNTESTGVIAAKEEKKSVLDSLKGLFDTQGTEAAKKLELEGQAGLPDLKKQANELIQQMRQNNVGAFTATQTSEDRQAPMFAITGEQAQIERMRSVKNYGLAAAVEAVNGNIALAQDNINRALDAEFKPLQSQIDYQKLLLAEAQDTLTEEQKKQADKLAVVLDERSRQLERQREDRNTILSLIPDIAGKADNATINKIVGAKTIEEALRLAAPYLNTAKTQLYKLDNGDTVLINTDTGELIKNYGGRADTGGNPQFVTDETGNVLTYGTPEYMIARLRNTAGMKGKAVASEREALGKFSSVIGLTESLMTSLNSTQTDPIIGYLRSLNPYDFDAATVNAQVTALVPSVARSLYGEVGVLTDTDIERYLKTLPNIKKPEDQNKFIALMTLANARRAYENLLLNMASAKVDVSGFVDSYQALTDKMDALEQSIGTSGEDFGSEYDALGGGGGLMDWMRGWF